MSITYSLNRRVVGKSHNGHIAAASGWEETTSTIIDLVDATAIRGFGFMPGLLTNSGKTKKHLHKFSSIVIDIDNVDDVTTWEQAKEMEFLRRNAVAMWSSANHQRDDREIDDDTDYRGQDRFRVLFKLEEDFRLCPAGNQKNYKEIDEIIKRLNLMVPGADGNITPIHYFAGTLDGVNHIFNGGRNLLNLDELPALPEQPVRVFHGEASDFSGSTQDSIANIERWLEHISSETMEEWLSVGGCLRNIGETIGHDVALQLFLDWSARDYADFDAYETERLFETFNPSPGGFGVLKLKAMDNGYEPKGFDDEPFDLAEFGSTPNGYKQSDTVTITKSKINEEPTEAEITAAVNRFGNELPARQMRMVIDELYGVTNKIKFNELTQQIEILGKPLEPHHFEDARFYLDRKLNILASQQDAQGALRIAANDNRFHPVKDYLTLLAQDKSVKDIDLSLVATRVLGVTNPLSIRMVECWLCGAVSRALEEKGSAFTEVLTLVSTRGGIGKSAFFKSLASPAWFSDSFSNTDNEKDRQLLLHSAWMHEISEIDQFSASKKDFKQMKGFVTSCSDRMRVPYGRTIEDKPRRCVLGATSNEEELFTSDDEQRRFWTIYVQPTTPCNRLDKDWLEEHRDEIWATATRRYLEQGAEAYKLTVEEQQQVLDINQETFSKVSLHQDELSQWLEEKDIHRITPNQIFQKIGMDDPAQNKKTEINGVLRREGYVKKRNQQMNGKNYSTVWVHPSRNNDYLGKDLIGYF